MKWTKSNIHHAMRTYDRLQDHMFDEFYHWWEEERGSFKSGTPEWDEFWDGMKTLNDNSFFDYDWKTSEWIIRKGDQEFRFPRNWPCDDLEKEPDLTMLWHSGYWDGPLSGMAMLDDKYVWFDCSADEDMEPYYGLRVYKVYELSDKELEEEFFWHEKFETHVGKHTNYGRNYAPYKGQPKDELDKFYVPHKQRTKRDYTDNRVLGEFTEVQFKRERPLPSAKEKGNITEE